MNLNEEISRIKKMMGLMLEYIDIPKDTEIGVQTNDNSKKKENRVFNMFHGDTLELKNYIQKIFPNVNLTYLGAGANGIAFEPKGELSFPPKFMEKDFIGQLPPKDTPLVLKLTINMTEVNKIKNFIQNYGGMAQGLASYYFIKEIDLPSEKQFSTTLGGPTVRSAGHTKEMRIDDFKKMYDRKWYPNISDKEYEDKIEKTYQNFIELKKKRGDVKFEKTYLICLDKVTPLSKEYKDILELCFSYYWFIQYEHKTKSVGQKRLKPIGVIRSVYMKDSMMKDWYDKGVGKEVEAGKPNNLPTYEVFKETFSKLIDAIEKVWSGKDKPKDFDLQAGNMGLKNGEFVFFDMYA